MEKNVVKLEKVLKEAAMENKTVILTTLNVAWASPGSIIDLFFQSFRTGDGTRRLLDHLVIIALDKKAYIRCISLHTHCFALYTEGMDFSDEKIYMTAGYLSMMWRRIEFLRVILEMGYNFIFSFTNLKYSRVEIDEDSSNISCCDAVVVKISDSTDNVVVDVVDNVANDGVLERCNGVKCLRVKWLECYYFRKDNAGNIDMNEVLLGLYAKCIHFLSFIMLREQGIETVTQRKGCGNGTAHCYWNLLILVPLEQVCIVSLTGYEMFMSMLNTKKRPSMKFWQGKIRRCDLLAKRKLSITEPKVALEGKRKDEESWRQKHPRGVRLREEGKDESSQEEVSSEEESSNEEESSDESSSSDDDEVEEKKDARLGKNAGLTYFTTIVPDVMEIIQYFGLDKLVHCTHLVNLDLCKEFYTNLHPRGSGGHTWVSRVGCVDIEFTPSILQSFLECRASESSFTCFPTVVEPFTDSLSHLSIEVIHQYYFNAPRAPLRRIFDATRMSARSNILYKVVIGCILPIVTRGQAKIRLPHLVMMYALEHRLDINIALHVFESIVHFSSPTNEKLYMPYCHILMSFFASRGLDVMRGQLHQLSKDYDQIGARQLSLAGIERRQGEMVWRAQEADDSDAEEADVPPPALAPHPAPMTVEARLTQLEETVRQGFQEFRGFRQDWTASQQRQADMYAMLQRWDLTYQAPPPPPSDDH
ncbi:hypothetical protein ZIOFF_024480 [Zingiber officinale]|uniref:Nucleotide-diphospho-sugar transferase domain-containing protein n=1 Tax=Zingiber officinale TaxID=94328 RepID=A0A8J5H2F7_ZINOF|nr:hypothetical protein ZIOFF_024480 [Zingiber officinale]